MKKEKDTMKRESGEGRKHCYAIHFTSYLLTHSCHGFCPLLPQHYAACMYLCLLLACVLFLF